MPHVENGTQCHGEDAVMPSGASAVTPDERRLIYAGIKENKRANTVGGRTARLILIAAAFGFLAAVLAIRLFPM
jgi:hypothetical protein